VIRLRRTLDRGRAHPILGPILLILLALLLALVFLHAAHEGHDAATEAGAFCLAILTILGPLLVDRMRRTRPSIVVPVRGDRGPPVSLSHRGVTQPDGAASLLATPLRR